MRKLIIAIMVMAVMASCDNKEQAEQDQTEQEQMELQHPLYSPGEYFLWSLQHENSHFYDSGFSWSKDTVFILSESGERIGKCALYEMQGENELFLDSMPLSEHLRFGLNDYFITDEGCYPFMPYSLSEYDIYEHEDYSGDGDTLKRWFIPSPTGDIDTVYCTFGIYEQKLFLYNIVTYYRVHRKITITDPDDITLYRASGVAMIRLGDNAYEYPFKDQWLAVVKYGPNFLDRDAILLAYGVKVGFSLDEITVFAPLPRWVIPLVNVEEIKSWEFCQPEYYRPTNFALFEYKNPESYFADVINEKIYDSVGNEVCIDSIKIKKNN